MTRKTRIFLFAALLSLLGGAALAAGTTARTPLLVYKSSTCGCCTKWIDHLAANGLKSEVVTYNDMAMFQRRAAIPARLQSCHVALAGRYLVVGHVPAADIKRLLAEKPVARGIAVGGMPAGSPGMDIPNSPPYETLLFQADGSTTVFARHQP